MRRKQWVLYVSLPFHDNMGGRAYFTYSGLHVLVSARGGPGKERSRTWKTDNPQGQNDNGICENYHIHIKLFFLKYLSLWYNWFYAQTNEVWTFCQNLLILRTFLHVALDCSIPVWSISLVMAHYIYCWLVSPSLFFSLSLTLLYTHKSAMSHHHRTITQAHKKPVPYSHIHKHTPPQCCSLRTDTVCKRR